MVKLNNEYYVGSDKYNWILYKKQAKKKDAEKGEEPGYTAYKFYPTLESLLKNTLEMELRGLVTPKSSLVELIDRMTKEREDFLKKAKKLCEGIKKEGTNE